MKKITFKLIASAFLCFSINTQANTIMATDDGLLGLYAAKKFEITKGQCQDCAAIPQARWYFEKEWIAVPNKGMQSQRLQKQALRYKKLLKIKTTMLCRLWYG
jgi:hypothetical protein